MSKVHLSTGCYQPLKLFLIIQDNLCFKGQTQCIFLLLKISNVLLILTHNEGPEFSNILK